MALATVTLTLYDDHHYLYLIGASEKEAHGTWEAGNNSLRLVNSEGTDEYTVEGSELFREVGSLGFVVFAKR